MIIKKALGYYLLVMTLLTLPVILLGQSKDTTTVAFTAQSSFVCIVKDSVSPYGRSFTPISSQAILNPFNQNLSDLLSRNSGVFLRTYTPGGLSTLGIRGASANQTLIEWNGVPLYNSMNASHELSNLNTGVFAELQLNHGDAGTHNSYMAPAGTLMLGSSNVFNNQTIVSLSTAFTSTQNSFSTAKASFASNTFFINTVFNFANANNKYRYKDVFNTVQTMNLASFYGNSFLTEMGVKLGKNAQLIGRIWRSSNNRKLPPSLTENQSSYTRQTDEAVRNVLDYKYAAKGFKAHVIAALMIENLQFVLPGSSNKSESKLSTYYYYANLEKALGKKLMLGWSANNLRAFGIADNYNNAALKSQATWVNRLYFNWILNSNSGVSTNLRAITADGNKMVLSPNIALSYQVMRSLRFTADYSKNYRVPTLNDKYWSAPSFIGNAYLRPEIATTYSLGYNFYRYFYGFLVKNKLVAYGRNAQDLIVWQPENGIWHPINVDSTRCYGSEFSFSLERQYKKVKVEATFAHNYTRNMNYSVSSGFYKKQLAYVPVQNAFGTLNLGYRNIECQYTINVVSKRFTTLNNTLALKAYTLHAVALNYRLAQKNGFYSIGLSSENLLNTSYQNIQYRPMPLQVLAINVRWTFFTFNKNHENKEIIIAE